ncbi:glycosyltransferase [Burkholderia vietnamiensis]|uniref:glycosyltransferase n=1 Tax=Burkholderia vietnamiensis TaxID=60552 RepID=UPI0007C698CC|nr:glycosyltransferase [Burkholderia vietnamiensis]MBR8002139.1 glycosyltransferase [Burkholderia vietnamiensis]HDR9004181.1 glycosyltransferase [Burkholderia vietnamiensis]HDV8353488.1 glycosyltransferase [Burkholderia vietnamiensis]
MRVFVTTELFPFTHGGIGRAIANIVSSIDPADPTGTAIVWVGNEIDATRFASVYPNIKLIVTSKLNYELVDEDGVSYPPEWAFTDTEWHWRSVRALQGLRRLAREVGTLEYIEFPDWGGLGFATTQEKLLGRGFDDSVIAVRLHTVDSLLADVDSRLVDKFALATYDLERKTLADCDRIIAQLPEVGHAIKRFFGFADEVWSPRVCVHAPPVTLDFGEVANASIAPSADTAIVFSSKIQHLKRPELFLRGACGFLRANPEYRGNVVFAAHSSPDATARLQRMIPADLRQRFVFLDAASPVERARLIARSISVTASPFESFCLSAYEASLAGAVCVLNGTNPAFGDNSPWHDGVNCHKFDGTAEGLAAALSKAYSGGAREVVRVPADRAPWTLERPSCSDSMAVVDRPLVSVVVPHFNLGEYLPRTLDSVLASTYENIEIVVVDDCSTDELSRLTIERMQAVGDRLRIIRNPMNLGLAATRNAALRHVRGEFVLTLDADDLIGPQFIELAVKALRRNPGYDFVVPQTGFFLDNEEGQIGRQAAFADYAVFYGEARAVGMYENRFSTATCIARTSVLRELRYRDELEAYEDWDLYTRAVTAGKRFIVTTGIHFFYRRRANSMYHTPERLARHRALYHALLTGKVIESGDVRLPLYVLESGGQAAAADAQNAAAEIETLRGQLAIYQHSRAVFATFRILHYLNIKAPWVVRLGRTTLQTAWRVRKRLRA